MSSDVGDWDALLDHDPAGATTENLEQALALVRARPFKGTHRKRYRWASRLEQRLRQEIVDAAAELARRRLMEGRWRSAAHAAVVGLDVVPTQESLWRLRILAAHESRDRAAEAELIEELLALTEDDEGDLEPETQRLIAALEAPGNDLERLIANA